MKKNWFEVFGIFQQVRSVRVTLLVILESKMASLDFRTLFIVFSAPKNIGYQVWRSLEVAKFIFSYIKWNKIFENFLKITIKENKATKAFMTLSRARSRLGLFEKKFCYKKTLRLMLITAWRMLAMICFGLILIFI
jgi:hypothetical protein